MEHFSDFSNISIIFIGKAFDSDADFKPVYLANANGYRRNALDVFSICVYPTGAVSFVATRGSKPETVHVLLHALLNNANF